MKINEGLLLGISIVFSFLAAAFCIVIFMWWLKEIIGYARWLFEAQIFRAF